MGLGSKFALSAAAAALVVSAHAQTDEKRPPAGPLAPDTPIAKGYDAAAKALAEADGNPMIRWAYRAWCETGYRTLAEAGAGQVADKVLDRDRDKLSPKGYIDPGDAPPMPAGGVRFMDNAWYFGTDVTGMVVVKTAQGLLLFDALTDSDDMQVLGIDQMKAAGLDPAQIKYIFLGHEHGDHIGGVNLILDRYAPGARIVASSPAADAIAQMRRSVADGTAPIRWFGAPPKEKLTPAQARERMLYALPRRIDIRVDAFPGMRTGMKNISVGGGIEVVAMLSPGHTLGQLNVIVPVTLSGKPEKLLVWSGNDTFERAALYAASTDFVRSIAMAEGASAFFNTHAYQGAEFYHLRRLKADPNGPNPIAMGKDGVQRYLGLFAECQRAQDRRARDGTWSAL